MGGEVVNVVGVKLYSDCAAPLAAMTVAVEDGKTPAPVGDAAPMVVAVVAPCGAAASTRAEVRSSPPSWIVDPARGASTAVPALATAAAMPEQIPSRSVRSIASWQLFTAAATAEYERLRSVAASFPPEGRASAIAEPPQPTSSVGLKAGATSLAFHDPTVASDRVICRRWQDHTGILPEREGQTVDMVAAQQGAAE